MFAGLGLVDMIVAHELSIVTVWVGAGVSEIGPHFSRVVPPMISNTPWIPSRAMRMNHRHFADDLRRRRGVEPIDITDAVVATVAPERPPAGTRAV